MRIDALDVLLGSRSADLIVRGGRVVDVFRREVREADVAVKGGTIVKVGDVARLAGPETAYVEADGRYVTPGLIECHAHSYHCNLGMTEYARLLLRRGTTAVPEAFYGQGQIRGAEAVRFFYEELRRTPVTVLFLVPVLAYLQNLELGLAATPGTITSADMFEMLDWEDCLGLEEPPYIPIAEKDPAIVRLIDEALRKGKVVMGHGAALNEDELVGYGAMGVTADHECITAEEAVRRIENGILVSTRETPIARNQRDVQRAITDHGCDPSLFMFSSDVPDAVSYATVGHIDEFIRIAIEGGIDPLDAIRMGTINTARYYRVDHRMGVVAPGRQADLLLVGDLERFDVQAVVARGELVMEDGVVVPLERPTYPTFLQSTVKLARPATADDLRIPAPEGVETVTVRVIGAESLLSDERHHVLRVVDGAVETDVAADVLKVAMYDRYARWAEPAVAYMQGFGLKRGAIGTSYNPFYNNVMVLGTNDGDMAAAANAVADLGGGFVAVEDGAVIASVPLPLVGLLSDQPWEEAVPALQALYAAVEELGCTMPWPFHNFAFTAVVGELPILKLSDQGLFDVVRREHLSTIVDSA